MRLRRNAIIASPPPYSRGPWELRRDAKVTPPPPYFGATTRSQKCHLLVAPMGRVTSAMQQCRLAITPPNHSAGGHLKHAEMPPIMRPHLITGGQVSIAEMPCIVRPHLTTGSHANDAEMPRSPRSHFIWCRSTRAEMPLYWRTNNQRPL